MRIRNHVTALFVTDIALENAPLCARLSDNKSRPEGFPPTSQVFSRYVPRNDAGLGLHALRRGVERCLGEHFLDGVAVDERQCQELVHGGNEVAAVDKVVLAVADAGVLRAPCLVVDVGNVIDLGVNLHVHGMVRVQVVRKAVVAYVKLLRCDLSHGHSFRQGPDLHSAILAPLHPAGPSVLHLLGQRYKKRVYVIVGVKNRSLWYKGATTAGWACQ